MNLVDMFLKGQDGQNIEALARQFNLSQQQAQDAIEALMPAFSQGLRRNTADPMGMGSFVQALSGGQHVNYFDNPQAAFNPSGVADGNAVLGQLFGSKDLSRAVAEHASKVTGLTTDTLKQMLPVVASMLMGGLYKKSTGQFAAAGLGGGNVIGDLIEQMMKQAGGAAAQPGGQAQSPGGAANPSANPWGDLIEGMFGGSRGQAPGNAGGGMAGGGTAGDNPLGRIFEEMMRGGQPPAAPSQPTGPNGSGGAGQNPFGDSPFGKIFEEMMKGAQQRQPAPAPSPEPEAPQPSATPSPADNPLKDMLDQMFESGRKTNETYQKGVESIFDQYLRGMDRNR
ncbi:DUF937 domain-containing protein [Phyllobacterium sp. 21LDTY02-6]|uniref:DUF937 domain-containing protein n=1 Tax=unclassified Phyllobacterium TaxID=2638441 RepID=UPI00201FDF12|nr:MULTISPECIES: DUF937 domain-containing protein [unclassified Phyllobacterium]MCO4318701.1 DUF937 domain-containing protein [Phyllobacterium sp. 21LDTY02-6]MCX8281217.1 DUF937 domain-containing protein [Phyllobacterium sp. 0TCS1.6C]MCX8294497.1 DUF937 domain-containing protein [Phyllobacterium sp. 0TCS1.6A]